MYYVKDIINTVNTEILAREMCRQFNAFVADEYDQNALNYFRNYISMIKGINHNIHNDIILLCHNYETKYNQYFAVKTYYKQHIESCNLEAMALKASSFSNNNIEDIRNTFPLEIEASSLSIEDILGFCIDINQLVDLGSGFIEALFFYMKEIFDKEMNPYNPFKAEEDYIEQHSSQTIWTAGTLVVEDKEEYLRLCKEALQAEYRTIKKYREKNNIINNRTAITNLVMKNSEVSQVNKNYISLISVDEASAFFYHFNLKFRRNISWINTVISIISYLFKEAIGNNQDKLYKDMYDGSMNEQFYSDMERKIYKLLYDCAEEDGDLLYALLSERFSELETDILYI